MSAAETLELLDWKRRVFSLYADVRTTEPEAAWKLWRETRDQLFSSHPQSPLPAERRSSFAGLEYWPYDPQARVLAELEDVEAAPTPVETSGTEPILFRPFARASFELRGEPTSGRESYGGGRYLLDTVKGADLGEDDGRLVLDFNFAYNPSCAYDPGWVCPLAPPANRLTIPVEAGERHAA
jgi:uncharacterized protein (DUF1684 family)